MVDMLKKYEIQRRNLENAFSCGILTFEEYTLKQASIAMALKQSLLNNHPYSIYEGKDHKWYSYIMTEGGKRRKIKKGTRTEVEDIIISHIREQLNNPTIVEIFHSWNDERLDLKEISKNSYDRYNDGFKRHFQDFGNKKIKDLSPDDWIYFLKKEKADKDLNKKAIGTIITLIKGIVYQAKVEKVLPFNLGDFYDDLTIVRKKMKFNQPVKEDYQEVFDEDEYSKMLSYLRDNLDDTNTGLLLMFVTGIRVGELASLKHEDIQDNIITIRRTETKSKNPSGSGTIYYVKDFPKTEKGWRKVVVPRDYQFLLARMKRMNPFQEFIFYNRKNERMTTNSFRRRQERICDKLGIYRKSPHKARKTLATIYLDEKLDNNLITSQLGWTNIAVGEEHYHRNRKSISKKEQIISNISELTF